MEELMKWLRIHVAFEEDDGGGSGGGSDDSDDGDDDSGDDDDEGSQGDSDDDNEKSREEILEAENNRLKREAADRAKKDRQAQQRRKREEGKLEDALKDVEKERDELQVEFDTYKRGVEVEKAARAAGMEFPEDAVNLLSPDDMKDPQKIEKALRDLKKKRPKLFVEVRSSGGDIGDRDEDDDREARRETVSPGLQRLQSVQRNN